MKKYIIYGNCQANALANLLGLSSSFSNEYEYCRIKPAHRITSSEYQVLLDVILPTVDLVIFQPVSKGFRGGGYSSQDIVERIGSTPSLSFPSLQFYGYQAGSRNIKNLALTDKTLVKELFGLALSDLFHNGLILESYLNSKSVDVALDRFENGRVGSENNIISEFDNILKKVEQSEKINNLDILSYEFIKSNYMNERLFYTPRHPSSTVFVHIIEQILQKLNLGVISSSEKERMVRRDPLNSICYPIQAFVREELGLVFDSNDQFVMRSRAVNILLSNYEYVKAFYSLYQAINISSLERNYKDYFIG